MSFDEQDNALTSMGIYLKIMPTTSEGITTSYIKVFCSIDLNNNTKFCCQVLVRQNIREVCTTLIVFGMALTMEKLIHFNHFPPPPPPPKKKKKKTGRPSPPEIISVNYTTNLVAIKIYWTATSTTGVEQNYTICLKECTDETKHLYYIYHQNKADSHIDCFVYVIAVNGAGESEPSNNVTIPSLPDIGPVTASLTHQVWKSNGEIMVNVSFKVSYKYLMKLFMILKQLLTLILKLFSRLYIVRNIL